MTRFVPRAQADAIHRKPGTPLDYEWYRYLRGLSIDLDAAVDDGDTNAANLAIHEALTSTAHGWALLTDKAIATGSNSIAHGLGVKPTEVMVVKDLAPPVRALILGDSSGTPLTNASWSTVPYSSAAYDFGGDFNLTTERLDPPHTGLYYIGSTVVHSGGLDNSVNAMRLTLDVTGTPAYYYGPSTHHGTDTFAGGSSHSMVPQLIAGQLMEVQYYQNTGANRGLLAGRTTLSIRSDDSRSEGAHDAVNLTIWSARTRTMSFLVR